MERLVETPGVRGPPKNQQVITHFFAQETALAKKKLKDSKRRRQEKGLNWYSKFKKSPKELMLLIEQEKCTSKRKPKQRPKGRMQRIRKHH
jgi:hypothetical protein